VSAVAAAESPVRLRRESAGRRLLRRPVAAVAAIVVAILVIVMGLLRIRALRRPDGRAFLLAIAAWALGRALVATTWRDPVASGPFRLEQVIDLAVAAGAGILLALLLVRQRRAGAAASDDDGDPVEPPGR